MAPGQNAAKLEREKKIKAVLTFGSTVAKRLENQRDVSIADDLQTQMRSLPLLPSSTLTARQDELDKLGTDLWNLSTRLRRDDAAADGKSKEMAARKNRTLCLLRAFAFLVLDSAAAHAKGRSRKACFRLMKVALKAARVCTEGNELIYATKILEQAAEYQDILSKAGAGKDGEEGELADRLRLDYFAMRIMLAWRQDRIDTAEHIFAKCQQLNTALTPRSAESLADLLYEIARAGLKKHKYESTVRWSERAYDILGDQDMEMLSPEAGELRLSIMHSIVQAYMKLKTPDARDKAWQMLKLMEADYTDKMAVSLLKIELLSAADSLDSNEFYIVLLRMVRTIVLNDTNFKTIMHHVHKLKESSNTTACKVLDDLIEMRLFQEENQAWLEKAVIMRLWVATTTQLADNVLQQLEDLLDTISQNTKGPLSAPATHAAQTLLWKRVEAASGQDQFDVAQAWCRLSLHSVFDKAGAQNRAKIARKIIQCALCEQNFAAAREAYKNMSDTGKEDPITQYLMYKVGLRSEDIDLATASLDHVCRSSAKDATLLYACVMEASSAGDKKQALHALQRVLEKYDYNAPPGIHLPALLRLTARLLQSELIKDGALQTQIMDQLCKVFEGASAQAKASKRRPSNSSQQLFTQKEFEWFSKNAYNLSLKHCAEMAPNHLVKMLNACTEFIKLLKDQDQAGQEGDLCLRLVFCEFLAACAYITLARAEDNMEACLQYYLEARKHSQEFRRAAAEGIDKLGGSAQADIISKHFQIVKLELEAALKLERWDELDDLFDQCWKYKSPDRYETLADLVLVIHSCVVKADVDEKYQRKVLSVLHKIIDLTSRQARPDLTKLARWLRCLFNLALSYDESVSIQCIDQAVRLASKFHEVLVLRTPPPSSEPVKIDDENDDSTDDETKAATPYPRTELEWLATTAFNHGVDYYLQENDKKSKEWAEQSFRIASWLDDEGALREMLMQRYKPLTL
ncbi:meiosis protein SPO22/ZIP4 like-domain-containing protein [Paraphoma chrysanthemicola]|uniref:Meiosis protein SPO22/ZIP4 like-domain-containing protein n=1 Tax=Paraphoma chrysanthemicola TaxID=798071 RepID=A0A8K0W105_9PLEO|nr:meiosis protein SPO22/ZIP4 like-domain-containing protein [Paraphoma chrysanthemicola]